MKRGMRAVAPCLGLAVGLMAGSGAAIAAGPPGANPDGRVYEMVSPPEKDGVPLGRPGKTTQSSPAGDAVAFAATGAWAGSETSMFASYYVARRSAAGWSVAAADPSQSNTEVAGLGSATRLFSEDLDEAIQVSGAALAPGALQGGGNLYRWDAFTGRRTLLAAGDGAALVDDLARMGARYRVAATGDLSHVVFATRAQLLPEASPNALSVYEVVGDDLRLVSLLPGEVTPPGDSGVPTTQGWVGGQAMSRDGRRVFFTSPAESAPIAFGPLYMRVDGETTEPISVSRRPGDPSAPQGVQLAGISDDGVIVYFLSARPLTEDGASGANSLYRLDTATDELVNVTPVTYPDDTWPATDPVFYVTPDGSAAYFVSANKLTPDAALNTPGQLYRYDDEDGLTFIAASNGAVRPVASRDGRYFAFSSMSTSVMGFDTADPDCVKDVQIGHMPDEGYCSEVYVYDAVDDELRCATCVSDDGSNQHSYLNTQSRWVSDYVTRDVTADGRVFFTSKEALVEGDVNGEYDVYQWKDGVNTLITTGRDSRGSEYMEASEGGRDIFFKTAERLVAIDTDDEQDLYTARIDGGIPAQGAAPAGDRVCHDDGCQGALSDPPVAGAIGSLWLDGAGDTSRTRAVRARVSLVRGSVRGSSFRIRVRAPRRGRIVVSGSDLRRSVRSVSGPDSYVLRMSLTAKARERLAQRQRLRVKARVVFSAASGVRSESVLAVTFKSVGDSKADKR